MRSQAKQFLKYAILTISALICAEAGANYLIPVQPMCNYRSLLAENDCVVCEDVSNFTRDYTMGKGLPPSIDSFTTERLSPFLNEYANVKIVATTDGGATDGVGAQKIMSVMVDYTLSEGASWYTNNWQGNRIGEGMAADSFTREVLTVKNQGTIMYKQYESKTKPWAVSPESGAFVEGDMPAPNRRCYPGDPYYADYCNADKYVKPWSDDCPWGITCPLYDTIPPNKGEDGGVSGWPASTCSKHAGGGTCNVPGFPEGGGDILDSFPSLDPYPNTTNDPVSNKPYVFPNVPGEPLVRVNGVPAVSCDIYNGVNRSPIHPLCEAPISQTTKDQYNKFGIYSYKVAPGQGLVRFTQALDPLDKVDASFYSGNMTVWTSKLDMTQAPLSLRNSVGSSFKYHVKVYDTCGNLATGAQSKPYPPFPGENNEAYVGVYDFYYDQVPTDQDPMGQIAKDDGGTQCGKVDARGTDTLCPEDPMTVEERLALGGCADPGCECCYNECAPSQCTYNGALVPNVSAQCSNVGASGNPPGCGPEHDKQDGNTKYGVQEIQEFKLSHTAANLYLKTRVQGDVVFGCYGSWYPLVGCEYDFGTLGSKFLGYGAQILNTASDPPSTYYLIIIPDIPIYNSLPLIIDLNKMLAELMGDAYDGAEMERYADGGGGCKKPEDEEPGPTSCEQIGCDPSQDASADCDDDGYVNGTDSCPCDVADPETSDGCPVEDPSGGDPLAKYKCNSCQTGTEGSSLYVEMGVEDTIGDTNGGAIQALAMTLAIHDLNMDWLLYYACLNGMNLLALGQDQSPRISYYPTGARARSEVKVAADTIGPEELRSDKIMACLGRCDESDVTDGEDNDGDLAVLEPFQSKREDEGFDPTALQFEIKWQEPVANNDPYMTNLIDLGGYEVQIARGADGPYETLYVMCDPKAPSNGTTPTAGPSCYGMNRLCDRASTCAADIDCNPGPLDNGKTCYAGYCCMGGERDKPEYDEPYDGAFYSSEVRSRFPKPYNEDAPHTGFGFPGETISCVVDSDCDVTKNLFDDDKDGKTDEGCWTSNCYDNNTELLPDGQAYWIRARAFDIPSSFATAPTDLYLHYTQFTTPVKVQVLRNTWPPDAPDVVASYGMTYGGKVKVVWNANKETDIGGYAIYRCPANPLDAVIKTIDGTLDAYCADSRNFRMITKDIIEDHNGYFVDEGMGYYETGIGNGSATGPLVMTWSTCSIPGPGGTFIVDEKCNYNPAIHDQGVDGVAGNIMLGEGDGLPTPKIPGLYPGETFAYEWIDCATLSTSAGINDDLKRCGNIQDPGGAWWATGTALFNSLNDPLYLYDVSQQQGYNAAQHPPVLFYNGLVDGYKYFYFIKAVDSPYLGDGFNPISDTDECDNGITAYNDPPGLAPPTGCVNPISTRNCDDKVIAFDWTKGGNCSLESATMTIVPVDTQSPQIPTSVHGAIQPSGKSVVLSWNTPTDDRTQSTFNVYRAGGPDKLYACVRGGCETPPYADGCPCDPNQDVTTQCYQDPVGDWDRICDKPVKVCTNPPYYSVKPQTQGCDTVPYNPGCECSIDSDCDTCRVYSGDINESNSYNTDKEEKCAAHECSWDNTTKACTGGQLKCDYKISVCKIDQNAPHTNPPYQLVNDRMDNDGDGLIDEEMAVNGLDDDGDGLVDEDVGMFTDIDGDGDLDAADKAVVGRCPDKSYFFGDAPGDTAWGYADEQNWRSQERILSNTFTDNSVKPGNIYYYRIMAIDNAVYDPNDGKSTDQDPPPPNMGLLSAPIVVDMRDTLPPSSVTGSCTHPVTGEPSPCVGIMNVPDYEAACSQNIDDYLDDNYGGRLSLRWSRNGEDDTRGYYVYRASDPTEPSVEPPSGAFTRVSEAMVDQTLPNTSSEICFKDSGLQNNLNYYYAVSVVDVKGNESGFSEAVGPIKPKDTIGPMIPTWGTEGGALPSANGTKITLTWDPHETYAAAKLAISDPSETDFSHFRVFRSPDNVCDDPADKCSSFGTCTFDTDCGTGKTCDQGLCCTGGTTCCGGNLTQSTFVDNFVAKDKDYYYCVAAYDTSGNRQTTFLQLASPVQAVDQVPPAAPTGLVASRMENSEIGLGWKQSTDSDLKCYRPYFSSTSTNTGTFTAIDMDGTEPGYIVVTNLQGVQIECVTELSYIHKNIPASNNVYYRLTAIDIKGNEGAMSDYVVTMPALTDFYAPPYPEKIYTRAGYHSGEAGSAGTDGKDNDGNGFIDDKIIKLDTKFAEVYWDRVRQPDTEQYLIYRRDPPYTVGCTTLPKGSTECEPDSPTCVMSSPTCDVQTNPLGDCDGDNTLNATDVCPCVPTNPSASQFGDYKLLATKTVAEVCPTTTSRPVGTEKGDICLYEEKKTLCPGSRYWYAIVPVDKSKNTDGLDPVTAMPVLPVPKTDNTAPEKPAKPKIAVAQSGKSLVVKFTENNASATTNMDLAGYIIYRDTLPKGAYTTKVAIINDTTKLNYCTQLNQPPCYCDEINTNLACVLDVSVEQKKRYYYKVSAFDFNGNESELSDWNNGTAAPTAPVAVTAFSAIPKRGDDYSLSLSWNAGTLLDDPTVKGFLLYRADATDGTYQLLDPVPGTTTIENLRASSFVDTGLKLGSTYWYMVVTESVDGMQSPSVKTCGVSGEDVFPPSTPIGVRSTSGNQSVTLNWSANSESDLAGYNIYRSATRDFKSSVDVNNDGSIDFKDLQVNTSTITYPTFTDTNLTNGTTYYYCIKSYDDGPNFDTQGCYKDSEGNPTYPEESSCSYPITIGFPTASSTSLSKVSVVAKKGWNLVGASNKEAPSILTAATDSVASVLPRSLVRLDTNGAPSSTAPSTETSGTPAPEQVAGAGFWYYSESEDPQEMFLSGSFIETGHVDIPLSQGWNLVGSPFATEFVWTDQTVLISSDGGATFVAAPSSPMLKGAYVWNPDAGKYEALKAGDSISTGTGIFIRAESAATLRLTR